MWLQKSGSRGPRRSPARERTEAPPGCGFAPAHLPRRLCPLEGKTDGKTRLDDLFKLINVQEKEKKKKKVATERQKTIFLFSATFQPKPWDFNFVLLISHLALYLTHVEKKAQS